MPVGEFLFSNAIAYLINLASGETTTAIAAAREKHLSDALKQRRELHKALASSRSVRDEVRTACILLAQDRVRLGVTAREEPLWKLLSDESFQRLVADWIMSGSIVEGDEVKASLLNMMRGSLETSNAQPGVLERLTTDYLNSIDRAIFSNPLLTNWRHQKSLEYLREQVSVLRQRADEAVGVYTAERQSSVLEIYCQKVLGAWDIIDLTNLPSDDVEIGTQQLLLRQLYMPLSIEFESGRRGDDADSALARLEMKRSERRRREAGHVQRDSRPLTKSPRLSIGKALRRSRRIVVLGDPGAGKTTMLRWMATAYVLRQKKDPAYEQLPDTTSLPAKSLIPVLIRCRDLGDEDLCRSFNDFLSQHLYKTELLPDQAKVMKDIVLDRIARGEALLLVDGLDEITNPHVRMMFSQELERTAIRYPDAPIVVTSRIVGYRDMPYRMGSGFQHGVIAELSDDDKDLFARRWIQVTEQHQPALQQEQRICELIEALHSSDRIERLTGNPMLLTTLALVKRKVGKLPNRRTRLYAEAVSVLLNWNPRRYQAIEEEEAIPQLQYLAFEMCRRGVQRLTEDEALELLDNVRAEYPRIRAIRSRSPKEFLSLLEERSSILIKSGGIWQNNRVREQGIWEFRHLTFQEYLAARALLDGRYPSRDRGMSLAQQVAPLAGAVAKPTAQRTRGNDEDEVDIPESWREALRLLVSDCKDDDVDEILLSILTPLGKGDSDRSKRPRAALAALCLADEPNVSESVAEQILAKFASEIGLGDGTGHLRTALDRCSLEVFRSSWVDSLRRALISEYLACAPDRQPPVGGLIGMMEFMGWTRSGLPLEGLLANLKKGLSSPLRTDRVSAALAVMATAFEEKIETPQDFVDLLFELLANDDTPGKLAAAWALGWLAPKQGRNKAWKIREKDVDRICTELDSLPKDNRHVRRWLVRLLLASQDSRASASLERQLKDEDVEYRIEVLSAISELGSESAVSALLSILEDPAPQVRINVIRTLGKLGDVRAIVPLLSRLEAAGIQDQIAIATALGDLKAEAGAPQLMKFLRDKNTHLRLSAIAALGKLGPAEITDALIPILADENVSIAIATAAALSHLGHPGGRERLAGYFASENSTVRTTAMERFAEFRDEPDQILLSNDLDAYRPWIDVDEAISEERIRESTMATGMSRREVLDRYRSLAAETNLRLLVED